MRVILTGIVLLCLMSFVPLSMDCSAQEYEQDWYFDQEGFKSNQNTQFGIGEESINLFNGNLILSYVDLRIPGNDGNDLVLQRVYNSKVRKWSGSASILNGASWVGLGWTLHPGRLYNSTAIIPLAKPVLEMPDGSRHRFYPDIEQHSDSSFIYRSKENWGLRWISHLHVQIFFSDGTIWDFNDNPYTDGVPDEEGNYFARLRYIMNPSWCNPIYFYYDQTVKRNLARIQIGGDPEDEVGINPEVIFNTNESDHDILESIQYRDANGNVVYIYYEVAQIIYDEENDGVTKLLYSVTPPVGPPVIYSYDEDPQGWPCELINVNNPFGGNIHYEYAVQNIPISDGPALCPIDYIRTNTVISKTYSGSDIVTGTWTYTYDTGGCYVQVLDPAGNISRHFFKGLCDESDLGRWEIGLNYKNEFYEGLTTLLKTEEMTWYGHLFGNDIDDDCHHDPPISQCKWVSDCHAAECLARQPRLSEQKITLNSDYYSTFYNSYDLYGNVTEMVETLFNSTEPYRKTVTSYVWKQDEIFAHEFISGHITGLPLDQKIQKGSGSTVYHVKNQYYQGARWTEEEPYICKFGKLMAKTIDPDNLALHTYYEYEELDTTIPPYFDNHDGNLIRINDPNDHDTYYAWENSTLKSITTPAGWDRFDRSINYDTGLVETQTDPNGNITSFGYDPLGRLTEINYPIDASVNISYNIDPGDPLDPNDDYFDNVTTTRGGLTDSEIVEYFDDLGRVKKIRKKLGGFSGYSYIHYVYDSVGNKTFESEPTFFDSDLCSTPTCPGTYYQYDALGRVTQETTPDGTTTYVYDGEDTIITYPNSTTKTITKDPFGNITQVIDEGGTTFHYEYDLLNNLTKIYKSSPTSWDAKFEYDSAGRLLQEQPRGGGTNKYELDDNGNITKMTALITDGSYYIQTFDVNNRLTSQTFDDGHTFQFEYDDDNISQCRNCLGKMNKQIFTSPGSGLSGQINYNRYDALGKLLEVTYEFPDPVGTHTIGYSYDHFGNCDEIDYPTAGFHQKFDYGCDNRISSISQRVDSVEYNAAGGMSTIQFSNGVFTEIPTDENLRNRPDYIQTRKGYSGNTLMKLDYSYDNMGNIWELERSSSYGPNPVSPDVFTYDNFNRLTRVDYGVPSGQADPEYFAYTYDTRGNQLTRTSSAILESDHPSWSLEYNYYDTITTPGFVYEKYYNLIESPLLNGQTRYIDFGYFNRITDVSLDTNAYDLWESFDGFLGAFPPAGWTVYPDSYYWKIDSSTAHSECCSIKNNWNHENRWLITPLVNLDYFADPFLIYWEAATAGTSPTNRRTLISTDYAGSGDPAQANWTLLREITDNVTSSWSEIAIPLAAYAQESVYVAFQYDQETGTGVFWNIDDVFIGESSGPERISVSMTYDGDGRRIRKTVTHKVEPVQEEGFDGDFPPTGWLTYQVEGDPWDSSSYYVHSGSYSALHTYFESDQDSWLISPAIDLTGLRDPRLNYWELVEYGNYAEQHNVLISTDYAGSGDPSTATWDLINSAIGTEMTWVNLDFSLSAYSGQTIYVAWQYTGYDAADWYIDDIYIGEAGNPETISHDTYYVHDLNGNILAEIDDNGNVKTEYVYAGNYLIGKMENEVMSRTSRAVPPEVSPPGAVVPFSLIPDGQELIFRFEYLGSAAEYHVYGLGNELNVDGGKYTAKFCDLAHNYLGEWYTDGATVCEWTIFDPTLLPERFIIVAENEDGEGPYGTKDNGTPRAADLDGVTKADHDCEASGTSKVFYTYHLDHLGSVRLITDEEGEVVWPADFETNGPAHSTPFGEQYRPSTRSYDGTVLTSLRFTSKEFDAESQLSDFGARFLEHEYPARFVTHDPSLSSVFDLINPQSFNLYTYCLNNPINMIDPDGKYGRGAGFTDEQWKKFDKTQKMAAMKMEKRADKLEKKAAKLVQKGKVGAAADLSETASYLRAGAAVLNSDGTGQDGTIANAFSTADYQSQLGGSQHGAAMTEVGSKETNLNIDHKIWQSSGIMAQFSIGHESLHNVGLFDQQSGGSIAYKYGSAQQQAAYKRLIGTPKALINPDHIMDVVY